MIVAVTGGRDFNDIERVRRALYSLEPKPTLLIHGAAQGADTLAAQVAEELGIPTEAHPADWEKHGRSAGPRRNEEMISRRPDLLLAFPGSKGTANMTRQAIAAGIPVRQA
jgi:hypothetical protein